MYWMGKTMRDCLLLPSHTTSTARKTNMAKQLKPFTRDEVAQHNKQGDLYVIIDSYVYDLSKFALLHPGGPGVLLDADVGECTRRRVSVLI